jgi:hypothetical protein
MLLNKFTITITITATCGFVQLLLSFSAGPSGTGAGGRKVRGRDQGNNDGWRWGNFNYQAEDGTGMANQDNFKLHLYTCLED